MSDTRGATLADFTRPREQVASQDYVRQVAAELDVDRGTAERVADYIAAEIERVGGSDARLVFTVDGDGAGPVCSWRWAMAGLCPHIAGGASDHVKESGDD